MNSLNKFLLALILASGLVAGCGTIVPSPVTSSAPSWDTTNQNSGLIALTTNGFAYITAHARDRYNGLASRYSTNFIPPLKIDAGINPTLTNGVFTIDNEHLAVFATMNRWKKSGK